MKEVSVKTFEELVKIINEDPPSAIEFRKGNFSYSFGVNPEHKLCYAKVRLVDHFYKPSSEEEYKEFDSEKEFFEFMKKKFEEIKPEKVIFFY